jgi:hypothetical protein
MSRALSSDQAIDGLPTARGPTTLSGKVARTAVAVMPVARRLDRRVDCPDQTWVRARRRPISSEPMPRQLSAASPSEPRVGRPAVASGQVRVSRGAAARLRRCSHQGWDPALRFGLGFGGYSSDTGNKPQPSVGPSPRPACAEVARQPVRQSSRSTASSERTRHQGRAVPACRRACSVALRTPILSSSGRSPG